MTFVQRLQQIYDAYKFLDLDLSVNAEQFREMVGFAVLHHVNLHYNQKHAEKTSRFSQEITFIDDKVQIRSTMNDNQIFTIQISASLFYKLVDFFKEKLMHATEWVYLRTESDISASVRLMRSLVLQAINKANFDLDKKDILLKNCWFNFEMTNDKNDVVKVPVNIGDFDNEGNLAKIPFNIYGIEGSNIYFTGNLNYHLLKGLILNYPID